MSARDDIFSGVRRALGVTAPAADRRAVADARIQAAKPNVVPMRGQGGLETFISEAERIQADVVRVATYDDVAPAFAAYLDQHDLPKTLTAQPTETLRDLDFAAAGLNANFDPPADDVAVGVSEAFAGVAEIGSLVMPSGPANPVKVNFLPDTHMVVLAATNVVAAYEDVWTKLRTAHAGAPLPRTVTFITGPSRTADIEQTLLLGAHGPRRLLIVVVEKP